MQAQKGGTTLGFMTEIAVALGISVREVRTDQTFPAYRLRTASLYSNQLLTQYLKKFPLFGGKFLDYKD